MLSLPHIVVIFVVALVIFGPEKLPELARTLGKLTAEFRKATGDLRSSFDEQMRQLERDAAEIERKKRELADKQAVVAENTPPAEAAASPQFIMAPEISEIPLPVEAALGTSGAISEALPVEPANAGILKVAQPTPAPVPHETEIQPETVTLPGVNAHRS
jgi:TatA/E family protein of Tat protein translocase